MWYPVTAAESILIHRCRLHSIANVLNATELYTLKWLLLCEMNFTLIRKKDLVLLWVNSQVLGNIHSLESPFCPVGALWVRFGQEKKNMEVGKKKCPTPWDATILYQCLDQRHSSASFYATSAEVRGQADNTWGCECLALSTTLFKMPCLFSTFLIVVYIIVFFFC